MKKLYLSALGWYINKYNLKPQLSTPPVYYFKDRNGKEIKRNIIVIVSEYLGDTKDGS